MVPKVFKRSKIPLTKLHIPVACVNLSAHFFCRGFREKPSLDSCSEFRNCNGIPKNERKFCDYNSNPQFLSAESANGNEFAIFFINCSRPVLVCEKLKARYYYLANAEFKFKDLAIVSVIHKQIFNH